MIMINLFLNFTGLGIKLSKYHPVGCTRATCARWEGCTASHPGCCWVQRFGIRHLWTMDRSNAGPAFIPPVHHLAAKQLGSPSSSSSSAPSQNNTRYATRPSHQHYQVPDNHFDIISDEIQAALLDPPSSRRTHIIRDRIAALELTDFGGAIDWEKELMVSLYQARIMCAHQHN